MADFKKRVGERIAQARDAQGWTQAQLANRLGDSIDSGSISRWETGRVFPEQHLEELAAALGVDVSYSMAPEPATGTPDLMGSLAGDRLDRLERRVDHLTGQMEVALRLLAGDEPPERARRPRDVGQ